MDTRLIWLALGTFAVGVEGFVIATLLPAIAADSSVTITQAGYLVFAYAIAYAIGAPVLSAFTGKFDRRPLLAVVALVFAVGALREAYVADSVLSLLRERFDEAGDTGTELGADMMPVTAGSVLRRPPLSFALRLKARSLCSVKERLSIPRRTSGPGVVRGTRRVGGVTMSGNRRWQWRTLRSSTGSV